MLKRTLDSSAATEALGARLAVTLKPGCIIYLSGDLGAGKTTLARGLLQALGHHGAVKSPTFTLVEPYRIGAWRLFHWDLYRLTDPEELEFLGLRDQLDSQAALLIEWPEHGYGELPAADLEITLNYAGAGRECRLVAISTVGQRMLASLATLYAEIQTP
ncbi:MAG: tRNA (adenosine(37)-N6)-threonylcarbamoyltransferase complex ATPase subunit type 1 TsaE [Candidatus Competibacteraceae bacterium]|nr:tRNA (adenosine(37)-N6)-threonylcarbamoyltransferase complex ATPase subunit type 1 TsaE [Candidatus Competibacteraceae bacterium]MCB1821580.1 tRNA (adenosine(37)-N6)-threonylcarbamoyltransferase complex ATPase subunit type 1 TsaE [Candidatus Competibacteraceae bacterium]HRY16574.1 tRNA (adenosine(37)-N6)-threonylcarbamoyltransferase complex ATPase subunit type 1 TsaE [Candidatus Competibacteraceae bacterium]